MSSTNTATVQGGIPVTNIDAIDTNFCCASCKLMLLEPVQSVCCGTRLCLWCSKRVYPILPPFICPFCEAESEHRPIRPDRGIERDLDGLVVTCHKCAWTDLYQAYKRHLQEHHADWICPDCHESFFADNSYQQHREELCPERWVPCELPGCAQSIKRSTMLTHYHREDHQMTLAMLVLSNYLQENRIPKEILISSLESIEQCRLIITSLNQDSLQHRVALAPLQSKLQTLHQETKAELSTLMLRDESFHQREQSYAAMADNVNQMMLTLTVRKPAYFNQNGFVLVAFDKLEPTISPILKTVVHGYGFVLNVRITPDEKINEENWFSVFIALIRTDFDPVLFFPFPYDIHLCLYDQSPQGNHICGKISATDHPAAFARPQTEQNPEVGFAQFCKLSHFTDPTQRYRVHGKYFVGVYIDFLGDASDPFSSKTRA